MTVAIGLYWTNSLRSALPFRCKSLTDGILRICELLSLLGENYDLFAALISLQSKPQVISAQAQLPTYNPHTVIKLQPSAKKWYTELLTDTLAAQQKALNIPVTQFNAQQSKVNLKINPEILLYSVQLDISRYCPSGHEPTLEVSCEAFDSRQTIMGRFMCQCLGKPPSSL